MIAVGAAHGLGSSYIVIFRHEPLYVIWPGVGVGLAALHVFGRGLRTAACDTTGLPRVLLSVRCRDQSKDQESIMKVYVATHCRNDEELDSRKIIGIFSSQESAHAAVDAILGGTGRTGLVRLPGPFHGRCLRPRSAAELPDCWRTRPGSVRRIKSMNSANAGASGDHAEDELQVIRRVVEIRVQNLRRDMP